MLPIPAFPQGSRLEAAGAEGLIPPTGSVLRGGERGDTATELHCRLRHRLLQLLGPVRLLHQRGLP